MHDCVICGAASGQMKNGLEKCKSCGKEVCSEPSHGCAYQCKRCSNITCVNCLSTEEGLCPKCTGKPPVKKNVVLVL